MPFLRSNSVLLQSVNTLTSVFQSGTVKMVNDQAPQNDCQIEKSTVDLFNSLDATRVTYAKFEKRKKTSDTSDVEYEKLRQLLAYEDAPKHLQFNPFIRRGYRTYLSTKMCVESMFWWTNETINIWSHVFGWFLFVVLTINDIKFLNVHASLIDKVIVGALLVCFQICMIFSSIYHTFSCRSEKHYDCFLSFDLLGIALSLLAIYISGIYYAFWCHDNLRNFYTTTVAAIFVAAMAIQIPSLNVTSHIKMIVFVAWAAYGILPTLHWAIEMGGFQNTMVALLIPRVIWMYLISGTAFVIYLCRIPERWLVGKVDYFGHSHNWWHFFVLVALYYWHNTGSVEGLLQFPFYLPLKTIKILTKVVQVANTQKMTANKAALTNRTAASSNKT